MDSGRGGGTARGGAPESVPLFSNPNVDGYDDIHAQTPTHFHFAQLCSCVNHVCACPC